MKKDKEFERLIERIHKILEPDNSFVQWDEKIPDPDNPSQARQIDIIIRHPDYVKFIECRIHKKAQNVKWIETLIGQKCSLNIDKIIAVSATGFTKGAIKKAERFGIELRKLEELTDEEVLEWKAPSICYLLFYKLNKLSKTYNISIKPGTSISDNEIITLLKATNLYNNALDSYFHALLKMGLKENMTVQEEIKLKPNLKLDGRVVVSEVTVSGEVSTFRKRLELLNASRYKADSLKDRFKDFVTIENFEKMIEIIKSEDKSSIKFSFEKMTLPDNVIFSGDIVIGFGARRKLTNISCDNLKTNPRLPILKMIINRN